MNILMTGATGFIGTAVADELIAAGYKVSGLARSEAAAKRLQARGIKPHFGALGDLSSLKGAAEAADGVIHLAYMHGLSQVPVAGRLRIFLGGLPTGIVSRFMAVAAEADRQAISTIGNALKGSGRPLVTTFGTMGLAPQSGFVAKAATEEDEPDARSPGIARARNEEAVESCASMGVRATILRLPPSVHGEGDTGFVPHLIGIARKKRMSAFVGTGGNRWPAVHRRDAARLFRLVLEKGVAGSHYHGVAEEGVPMKKIAETIGRKLNVPAVSKTDKQAPSHFSFLAGFVAADNPSSSWHTRESLGWAPQEADLLSDLQGALYFGTQK